MFDFAFDAAILHTMDGGGPVTPITSVADDFTSAIPDEIRLLPNYPNPFNTETTISCQLPQATKVKLEIYNLLGQRVATLVEKKQPAGYMLYSGKGKIISGAVWRAGCICIDCRQVISCRCGS